MTWPLRLLVAIAFILSGCAAPENTDIPLEASPDASVDEGSAEPSRETSPSAAPTKPAAKSDELRLRGHVLTASLHPIEGATVIVVGLDGSRVTAADGGFDFGTLARRIYTLQVNASGYVDSSVTVMPDEASRPVRILLEAGFPVTPYNTTVRFRGILECAFEALIISPSCDSGLAAAGAPAIFDQNQSFLFQADPGWTTLVIDVVFDGEAHAGLEGLRVALRGSRDPDGGGEYMQYGRWHDADSFTVRVEPGGNYTDGVEPVPSNATGFQIDIYPHGHAYHEVCGGDSCFLGVGAALNVEFDVYATLFYVTPAPEGFTLRAA